MRDKEKDPSPSRRGLLAAAAGMGSSALVGRAAAQSAQRGSIFSDPAVTSTGVEPFEGTHQAGIATPQQAHTYFATFDLTTTRRDDIVVLLRSWTDVAAHMTAGAPAEPLNDTAAIAPDGGSALGLGAARLTLTFGFGPSLFLKDGADRYNLAAQRPQALIDLPKFNGDQLEPARCGGDLSVQACADDPQVAFHAIRELERIAYGKAQIRWVQSGFLASGAKGETPRNLMGFKDGTNNPTNGKTRVDVPRTLDQVVWVDDEGPEWMRGGTYLVARRIRISLEHWDRTELGFQEEVIGRHKYSGAPIGKHGEFESLDLDREDSDGGLVIADTAHVRLGAAAVNDGAQILRRAYSYNDGVKMTAERWPPWRQGMMYDAGLFFLAYQRDPRTGFIRIFENMAKFDMLNQYTTHNGSALFACPRGIAKGQFIGQKLFEA
jgi:deferrochelatase/peroxidase EfeB